MKLIKIINKIEKRIYFFFIITTSLCFAGCSTRGPGTFKYIQEQNKNSINKKCFKYMEINNRYTKYNNLIKKYSNKYNVDYNLVRAIIKKESDFMRNSISHSNAIGLMQIIPKQAGRDSYNRLYKKDIIPTKCYLYNEENNIKLGVKYLSTLKHRYFKNIKNKKKKELIVIASYNAGPGSVYRFFDKDRNKAINKINKISYKKLYYLLTEKFPSNETKNYVKKVLKFKKS